MQFLISTIGILDINNSILDINNSNSWYPKCNSGYQQFEFLISTIQFWISTIRILDIQNAILDIKLAYICVNWSGKPMGRGVGELKKTLRPLRKSWDSVGFILLVADRLIYVCTSVCNEKVSSSHKKATWTTQLKRYCTSFGFYTLFSFVR